MKRFIPFFFFFILSFATYATDLHIRFGSTPYNVSNNFIPTNNVANDNVFNKSVIGLYPLNDCGTGYSLSIFKNSITGLGYSWVNCTSTMFNLASYKATGNAHVSLVIDLGSTYYFPNMTAFRLNFSNDKTSSEVNGHDFGELTLLDSDKNIAYTTGNCYNYEFYVSDCQFRESGWGNINKSYFASPSGLSNYMNYTAFHNTTQFTSGHNIRYIVLTNAVGMVNYSIYNLDIYGVTQANNNQLPTATVQYTTPCFNSTVSYVDVPITVSCTDPEGDQCYYSDKQLTTKTENLDFNQDWETSNDDGDMVADYKVQTGWAYSNGSTAATFWAWGQSDYYPTCDYQWDFTDLHTSFLYLWSAFTGIGIFPETGYVNHCWLDIKEGAQPIYWTFPTSTHDNNYRIFFRAPYDINFTMDLLDNTGKLLYNIELNFSNYSQIYVNDIGLWKGPVNTTKWYSLYIGNNSVVFFNETIVSRINSNFSGLNDVYFSKFKTVRLKVNDVNPLMPFDWMELFSVRMWYPGTNGTLFNWTTVKPTTQRITMPDSRFHFYLTDTVHKDINYTQIDYRIQSTGYCEGPIYNPINGSIGTIPDQNENYLKAIDNGLAKFNYLFWACLIFLFILLIIETHSLELTLVMTGVCGIIVSLLLVHDTTQVITSGSLVGLGVTLFVSKSFM